MMAYLAIYQAPKRIRSQEFIELDDAIAWLDEIMPPGTSTGRQSYINDDGQFVEIELLGLEYDGYIQDIPVFGWVYDMERM